VDGCWRTRALTQVIRQPERRDIRFILLTVLVFAVVFDFGLAIYKMWDVLLANRYAPAPLIILIAFAIALPYFWVKTSAQRSALQHQSAARELDSGVAEIALRALYRGLFMAAMLSLLLLSALHAQCTHSAHVHVGLGESPQ
jgi:hypothetical protein